MEAIMAEPLITESLLAQLLANGARSAAGEDIDPRPVVKLFTPDAGATWLITEADPADPDRMLGLCDLGLPIERNLHFTAEYRLSLYAKRARDAGRIVTD